MSGLPTAERAAGRATGASRREPWSSGMWGMALFLATESALFGVLVASYFYLRFDAAEWPPRGVDEPRLLAPLLLTAGLVASAFLMQLAAVGARRRQRAATVGWLAAALALQVAYLAIEIVLFGNDLQDLSPRDNAYASAYFTLLGLHHAHVALGILLVAFVLARSAGGLTTYRVRGVQAVALYWLVVAALGVVVTLTVVSPSL
jgi:heme/copper-type cytochrome/quinol oxidase subunit 3